jgi:hypothetical protein
MGDIYAAMRNVAQVRESFSTALKIELKDNYARERLEVIKKSSE